MKYWSTIALICAALFSAANALGSPYDLVINHGRVIDPESQLDGVKHIGIVDGRITAIAQQPLQGDVTIDATGLIVAPGFIDLHTHSPTPLGQHYQAFDGVTTALELEAGYHPVLEYGAAISSEPLINYGASAGYVGMRMLVKNGLRFDSATGAPKPVGIKGWKTALMFLLTGFDTALAASLYEPASEAELTQLQAMLESSLDNGALGIGLALDYFSDAIQDAEMHMIFSTAARRNVPVFVHIRRGIDGDPSGLREVLALAAEYQSALHIAHISHNAISNLDLFLDEIAQAKRAGVDVTTEVLPYNAGSALISSAVFGRDWQTIFNITYEDVEWAATGQRFNETLWNEYYDKYPDGQVIHHYLQEAWTRQAVQTPGVIIVSDLMIMESTEKKVAPHNGAFSKVLGQYVRQEKLLDWPTALAKMTLLPARRLEHFAPAFKRKGRIQLEKDADITIFDPKIIRSNATYQDPFQEATGIIHVLVNGRPIIRDSQRLENSTPGRRMTSQKTNTH